ncbi:MAG: hypothetical protein JNK61_08335 [Bacteroidia bacterium]|nr:hypothetical protein [Bacteroidia bacterium]HQV01259.1 hypothetical protein [Bacteroidia bacterium]
MLLIQNNADALNLKHAIKNVCVEIVLQQIFILKQTINDLQLAANNESKSTAGDKHDTSKAILQQQVAMHHQQLIVAQNQSKQAEALPVAINDLPTLGSLIYANEQCFYIGMGIGKKTINNTEIILLAPTAPLAQFFIGLKNKTEGVFNSKTYTIKQCW